MAFVELKDVRKSYHMGEITIHAVDGISRKMVRRHPKIFGGDLPETDGNEGDLWERIKRAEKAKNHRTNA